MDVKRIVVLHTAFIGDIILTLPLVQRLRASLPEAHIAFVVIPSVANVLENHPAINEVIIYDKHRRDAGLRGILRLARRIRKGEYDVAIIPHRSLRSSLVGWRSRIPRRIGFSTSAGVRFFTDVVPYDKGMHEIDRNLSLLKPLGLTFANNELPTLYPSKNDGDVVDAFLKNQKVRITSKGRKGQPAHQDSLLVGIAPGSVWNTKRWPKEHFVALTKSLLEDGHSVVLIGGREDAVLCSEIRNEMEDVSVVNAAGMLSLLQSAELIRRCEVLVSNDSAPMHLATGVRTPVVAIYGATVPAFGFAPRGDHSVVAEMDGLSCRPCSIHGGGRCPIKTFVCMKNLTPEIVHTKVLSVVGMLRSEAQ